MTKYKIWECGMPLLLALLIVGIILIIAFLYLSSIGYEGV